MTSTRHPCRDDGNILLAVLLAIFILGLVAAATTVAIAGSKKTQASQRFTLSQQVADTAVADAMAYLNRGGTPATYPTEAKARTGTVCATATMCPTWKWWTEQTAPGVVTIEVATDSATRPTTTRRYTITAQSMTVARGGASTTGQSITYNTTEGPTATGFFANTAMNLRGSTKVDSYNSGVGATPTGNGIVSTNGTVTFGSAAASDRVTLLDYTASPFVDRCSGTACTTIPIETRPYRLGATGNCTAASYGTANCAPTAFIDRACIGKARPAWVASQQPKPVTLSGTRCYSSMTFDADTTVSATPEAPAKIYVSGGKDATGPNGSNGPITVMPGVRVNIDSASGAPASTRLLIYAKSDNVIFQSDSASAPAVAWKLWAPNADCTGPEAAAAPGATIYGAMLCDTLTTGTNWRMRYDEQQILVDDPPGNTTTQVWSITKYQGR